jgi:transcriptional regulator with XRE-family HTH domain
MGYKRLPREFCAAGSWPRGPFLPAPTNAGDDDVAAEPGLEVAAATVGRLVAALTNRRKLTGWSRAQLAVRSGVSQHTVGRIESGRTWPDLVTIAKLAQAMGMSLTMAGAKAGDAVATAAGSTPAPLPLGPTVLTPAQLIDALFAGDPRLAAEVAALARHRRGQAASQSRLRSQVSGGRA